ncbi:MAG: fasciclin domain-containing protein [Muribaculaceae bacterium]|nr:fasciclin domain-containing protein [Muribaculaceae bacterium]
MFLKNHLKLGQWFMTLGLGCSVAFSSCSDDYSLAKEEPSTDILGSSIYDYLTDDGNFTVYLRLIDDLDYRETLQRTGSKTVFPARDDAFERFFKNNPFGASSYEDLTVAQKKLLLNQSMVNMAYLSEMLPNVGGTDGPTESVALRRNTQSAYYDTIRVVNDKALFDNENGYWKRFNDKGGITLVEEAPMIIQFTPEVMAARSITDADFSLMHNGTTYNRADKDIYINGIKVVERDRICKNGYVHVLADVLTPLRTIADAIEANDNAKTFAKIMSRFSAPYYDATATEDIKRNFTGSSPNYPAIEVDSVFRKGYFNRLTHTAGPRGEKLGDDVLRFDPAQVSYTSSNVLTDMGVMFVPTDEAMRKYYDSPEGNFLKSNYPTWDDVPVSLLAKFIQNHQKNSFLTSLPHDWDIMNDEKSFPMNINTADVDHVELCSNGVVYFLNRVVAPVDFRATYAPTLVSSNTTMMRWALLDGEDLSDANGMRFFMYLYSMENMYNLIVPTDEALGEYRDPITWGNSTNTNNREVWEFVYDADRKQVNANVYGATPEGLKDVDNFKRTITNKEIIRSRFRDILDMHTVVGTMDDGVKGGYLNEGNPGSYVVTKGGANISIDGLGGNLTLSGLGDMELNMPRAVVELKADGTPYIYDNDNGRTYFIDRVLHDSRFTVYDVLGQHPDFQAFRNLCTVPAEVSSMLNSPDYEDINLIFEMKTDKILSVGTVVSFFNNYRYTILVPTAQAIDEAIAADPELYPWDQIVNQPEAVMMERTRALLKFIRYHFIDNSIYINGLNTAEAEYYSSARTEYGSFHSVKISRTPNTITVTDENGNVNTISKSALTNISARELLYHREGIENYIDASSHAVIHKIDHALTFKK